MAIIGEAVFDDCGVRFAYPGAWQVEVSDEGPVTTVALHSPSGPAFALVTFDESCPAADAMADQALEVMREEYPELDSVPAWESIGGHEACGHDLEFLSLDMTNSCTIRCFRTDRRTVLLFGQWSDLEDDQVSSVLDTVRASFEETDETD